MKKLLSISFAFIVLLSGMHFTIATHYCGGELAATKVSISGNLASCGMEDSEGQCPISGSRLTTNCCRDKVSVFVVDNNYAPSFSDFKAYSQPVLHDFYVISDFHNPSIAVLNRFNTNVHPPGSYLVSSVSLPDICVFRI